MLRRKLTYEILVVVVNFQNRPRRDRLLGRGNVFLLLQLDSRFVDKYDMLKYRRGQVESGIVLY